MSHGPSISYVQNLTIFNSSIGVLSFDGFSAMHQMFSSANFTLLVVDLTVTESHYGGYTETMLISGEVPEQCSVVLNRLHFADLYFEEGGSFLIINHDSSKLSC